MTKEEFCANIFNKFKEIANTTPLNIKIKKEEIDPEGVKKILTMKVEGNQVEENCELTNNESQKVTVILPNEEQEIEFPEELQSDLNPYEEIAEESFCSDEEWETELSEDEVVEEIIEEKILEKNKNENKSTNNSQNEFFVFIDDLSEGEQKELINKQLTIYADNQEEEIIDQEIEEEEKLIDGENIEIKNEEVIKTKNNFDNSKKRKDNEKVADNTQKIKDLKTAKKRKRRKKANNEEIL